MPAIFTIPFIGAALATFIRFLVGTLIARVLAVLGVSIVTYNISGSILNAIKSRIDSFVGGLPSQGVDIAQQLGFIDGFNVIFSAYVGALTIRLAFGMAKKITFGNSGS